MGILSKSVQVSGADSRNRCPMDDGSCLRLHAVHFIKEVLPAVGVDALRNMEFVERSGRD